MEQILMNLVVAALGGNAVGKSSPSFDLGTIGNTLAGLAGGGMRLSWSVDRASAAGGHSRSVDREPEHRQYPSSLPAVPVARRSRR